MDDKIISNISYTNKDFNSIYPELLDLVKKLTNKWDPSLSNESDPGVLLLKLNALVADKNNYNIDKNVLECFPTSVTQDSNARRIYDSLGYHMHWYKSATTDIGIQLKNNEGINTSVVTLPIFTMLCDINSEKVYTMLEKVEMSCLTANLNTVYNVKVMEGRCLSYTLFDTEDITLDMLDSNYRLYFNETNVAENGIFVKVSNSTFWNDWEQVDNLQLQPLGSKCFKFGVLPNGNTTYIEFPQDIATILKDTDSHSLNIKYIVSTGEAGNIKAFTLKTFLDDVVVKVKSSDTETATSDLIITNQINISQPTGTINGANPETVEDAYKNYKRTIGTFNTLVTLNDYENAVYNATDRNGINNLVSNVVVSDRTNDINSTLKVQTWTPNYNVKKTLVLGKKETETGSSDGETTATTISKFEPNLLAYDIVLYTLNAGNGTYDSTFEPNEDVYLKSQLENLIEQNKSIQHNVVALSDYSSLVDAMYYLYKNMFALKGQIVTYDRVSKADAEEIEANVMAALETKYNARAIVFGDELDYITLIETIQNADARIKTVALDMPQYQVHRVGNNGSTHLGKYGKFTSIQSKTDSSKYTIGFDADVYDSQTHYPENSAKCITPSYDEKLTMVAKMVLAGNVQLFKFDKNFNYDFGYTDVVNIRNNSTTSIPDSSELISAKTEAEIHLKVTANPETTSKYKVKKNEVVQVFAPSYVAEKQYTNYVKVLYYHRGDTADNSYFITKDTDWSSSSSKKYYQKDSDGTYKVLSIQDINKLLSMNLNKVITDFITLKQDAAVAALGTNATEEAKVQARKQALAKIQSDYANASGNYIRPNAIQALYNEAGKSTINVELYEYDNTKHIIKADENHVVLPNEIIKLVYLDDNKIQHTDEIKAWTIIKSSIDLRAKPTSDYGSYSEADVIVLSNSQSISIMKLNTTDIKIGSKVYWILNNPTNQLKLEKGESIILLENEYLLYTDNTTSDIMMLGSGTKIELPEDGEWNSFERTCELIDVNDFDVSDIKWVELSQPLKYTELDIVSAGPDSIISVTKPSDGSTTSLSELIITNTPVSLKDYGEFSVTDKANNVTKVYKYPAPTKDLSDDANENYGYYSIQSRLNLTQNEHGYQILENDSSINNSIIEGNSSTTHEISSNEWKPYSIQSVTLNYSGVSDTEKPVIVGPCNLYFSSIVALPGGEDVDLGVMKNGKKSYTLEAFKFNYADEYFSNSLFEREGGIIKIKGDIAIPTKVSNDTSPSYIELDEATGLKKITLPIKFKHDETGTFAKGWFIQLAITANTPNFRATFTTNNDFDSTNTSESLKEYFVNKFDTNYTTDSRQLGIGVNNLTDESFRKKQGYSGTSTHILWIPNDRDYKNLYIYLENGGDGDIVNLGKVERIVGFNTDEINVIPSTDNTYSIYDAFDISQKYVLCTDAYVNAIKQTQEAKEDSIFYKDSKNPSAISVEVSEALGPDDAQFDTKGYNTEDAVKRVIESLNGSYSRDIYTKISDLINSSSDPKVEFDYTYEVPESEKVLYPTLSSSYFNKNHIANKYVLPQIKLDKSSIKVNSYSIKS